MENPVTAKSSFIHALIELEISVSVQLSTEF